MNRSIVEKQKKKIIINDYTIACIYTYVLYNSVNNAILT